MSAPSLTLLYTANLAGQLALLPRLFTLIRQVRAAANGPLALIDLGGSCASDSWECAATEGRAALVVFDTMGYAAARLTEAESRQLSCAAAARLRASIGMPICAVEHPSLPASVAWDVQGRRVGLAAGPACLPEADLIVRAGESCCLNARDRVLWLRPPPGGVLAWTEVAFAGERPAAATFSQQSVPDRLRPDATIAAAVTLVRDEARRYQVRSRGDTHAAD